MTIVAKLVQAAAGVVALAIGVGVLLVALDAKESNSLVHRLLEIDRFLTKPFRAIIDLAKGKEHLQIAINWGIAALVYLLIGFAIAALVRLIAVRVAR